MSYDLDRLLNDHVGYPTVECPRCGHQVVDVKCLGYVECPACYHCPHLSRSEGVCLVCGESSQRGKSG